MTAFIVIAAAALLLLLLCLLPVGADIEWRDGRLSVSVRIFLFRIRIGGKRKQAKAEPESGESALEQTGENRSEKRRISPQTLRIVVKNGYPVLCRIVTGARVQILSLHFTSAWPDPAVTAMVYGAAGTMLDGLWHMSRGRVRQPDLRADVDFDGEYPTLELRLRFSWRLGRLIAAAARFAVGFLMDTIRCKREESNNG